MIGTRDDARPIAETVEFEVRSRDGTRIACAEGGAGPAILLVHGSGPVAGFAWDLVRPTLQQRLRVCTMDRRGHGRSEWGAIHSLEREVEDIVAVIETLEPPVHLVGHSMGGILALEAALACRPLRSLILYEPYSAAFAPTPPGLVERCIALVDGAEYEAAAEWFLGAALQLDQPVIQVLKEHPTWPDRVAAMRALPRELRADARFEFAPYRLALLEQTPVFLFQGTASPDWLGAGARSIHHAISGSRLVEMDGQKHVAMAMAPHDFAARILRCVDCVGYPY